MAIVKTTVRALAALTLHLTLGHAAFAAAPPVEVMFLGSYHFENPGLDTHNLSVDNVLTPRRQAELQAVAAALARFKPTQVMVEMESDAPGFALSAYRAFTDDLLKTDANEIIQLGFRTARLAGLDTVRGIDVQPKAGEPDYYPYDKVQADAARFGQTAALDAAGAPVAAWVKRFDAKQKTSTVAQLLADANSSETALIANRPYFEMLAIGDGESQAGADLNARWYLRNAKIFGKLIQAAKPGDRVLLVYGFGHGYWLRHFASETPGFRSVDPLPFLRMARTSAERGQP